MPWNQSGGYLLDSSTTSFPGAGSFGNYDRAGLKAGIYYRDVILTVNGQPITSSKQLSDIVEHTPVGTPIDYELQRKSTRLRVSVPVAQFTLRDLLTVFGVPFFNGVMFWVIGIIVYILKPDTEVR